MIFFLNASKRNIKSMSLRSIHSIVPCARSRCFRKVAVAATTALSIASSHVRRLLYGMGGVVARLFWWRKANQEDARSDVSSSDSSQMSASSLDGLISHEQAPRSSTQRTGKDHQAPIQKLPADLILR